MSDEFSTALLPQPALASSAGAEPKDRISVRDYVVSVEIGAFASERGVTQRIRFNVVLEVVAHTAAHTDDVDKVLSYDTIVTAIDTQLQSERVNLLETLAERVAERCLEDPRALRCLVRVEKLDRIPGALGVEIERQRRSDTLPAIGPDTSAPQTVAAVPSVVALGPDGLAHAGAWVEAIVADGRPVVLTVPPLSDETQVPGWPGRRITLLSMEQQAWSLAAQFDGVVVSSRTELEHCAGLAQLAIWAPGKIVTDAVPRPEIDVSNQAELAVWFAEEIGALECVLVGLDLPAQAPSYVTEAAPDHPQLSKQGE
ncbi:MAG: dihydroneopterin aldolase [Pseudomonadota bacterium]